MLAVRRSLSTACPVKGSRMMLSRQSLVVVVDEYYFLKMLVKYSQLSASQAAT